MEATRDYDFSPLTLLHTQLPLSWTMEYSSSAGEASRPGWCPGGGTAAAVPRGASQPAPFLTKTYDLVEASCDDVVSWNGEGTGFVVWSPDEFSQLLLPRYFKHCNFSSFIRQLNTYGFKKSATDRWEFQHEKFQKGRRNLLAEITRRKCNTSILPTFLNPGEKCSNVAVDDLLQENMALRKKNAELLSQITRYRTLEAELVKYLPRYIR